MATQTEAQFDLIPRRRYHLVAEWLGSRDDGQRTARWFFDTKTQTWFTAESWKRPNFRYPLNAEQAAYVESLLNPRTCLVCGHTAKAIYDDGSSLCGHCVMERHS